MQPPPTLLRLPYASDAEDDMNRDQGSGNWKQFEGKVQKEWGKLRNDDLEQAKGNEKILAGKFQERYGVSKKPARRRLRAWPGRF
jgi:uncharacterized protein YjbJ (UPF0337 family)